MYIQPPKNNQSDYLITMEQQFPSMLYGISSKEIVDDMGESVDENITDTDSRSEFDSDDSDCKFQSTDSESDN